MLVVALLVQVCAGFIVRFYPEGLTRSLGETSRAILGSYLINEEGIETIHKLLQYEGCNFQCYYNGIRETTERVKLLTPFMQDKRLHKTIFSGGKLIGDLGLAHTLLNSGWGEYTGTVLDVLPQNPITFWRGYETLRMLIENAVERGEECVDYQWLRRYLRIAYPEAANSLLRLFTPKMTPTILTEFLLFAYLEAYIPAGLPDIELLERSVMTIVTGHRLNIDCRIRFWASIPEYLGGVSTVIIASLLDTVMNGDPTDENYIELLSLSFRFAQRQRSRPWWSVIAYLTSICHERKISEGVCMGTAGIYLGTVPPSYTNPNDIKLVTKAYRSGIDVNMRTRFPLHYWPIEYRPLDVRLAAWRQQMPIIQWSFHRASTLDAVLEGVLIMRSYPSNVTLQSTLLGEYLIQHVKWVMRLTVNKPDPTLAIIMSLPYHVRAGRKCPIWQDIDLTGGWAKVVNRLTIKSSLATRKRVWKLLEISRLSSQFAPSEVFVYANIVVIDI
ncbi:hypothetical protein PSACC_03566 [Paramicrosporidium saccamoebae]|uniref:Uncharacterized protein n=1 Tax=Paramicrosporidium saccamoebae TaxID=1246581 RepID=A0A2H9TFT5_9FUNG|nr:hypothetical protein PSACC_03566 [Paramicrosporidium saccamoebae]